MWVEMILPQKTCLPVGTLTHRLFQVRETPFPGASPFTQPLLHRILYFQRFYLWCGDLTRAEFLGFVLDCLLGSVGLYMCCRSIWDCTGVSFLILMLSFLWQEPCFSQADTWMVIVCSSSWSVSSAASECKQNYIAEMKRTCVLFFKTRNSGPLAYLISPNCRLYVQTYR